MQQAVQNKVGRTIKFGGLVIFSAAVFVFGLALALPTHAADTGFFAPNQTVDEHEVNDEDEGWLSDNDYATFSAGTDYVDYGFTDFSIPSGSTIDGIEIAIEGQRESVNVLQIARHLTAAIWNASNSSPDAYTAALTATLGTSDSVITLGSSTHKWGKTWTVSDFADATFKIRVQATTATAGKDAYLDQVRIKIYYTLPDTTAPVVTQVTAVPLYTNDTTPNYTFNSTEAGKIIYGGDCSSVSTSTVAGNKTVTFNTLSVGVHSNCTIQVADASANTSTALAVSSFTVDTVAPIILPHDSVTAEATSSAGAAVDYILPTVTDGPDSEEITAVCSPTTGSLFAMGATTVTCNATDAAGNAATSTSFSVVVQDTTAPVINSPVHGFAEATGPEGAVATYPDLYAVDAVDGNILTTCSPLSGSVFPVGESHVFCNVSDLAGNSAIPMQVNVTVRDTTPPTITLIGDGIILMNTGDEYVDLGATAVDLVDGDVTAGIVVDSSAINNMVPAGYLVTYTSTDLHGISSMITRTVFVSDHSAPVFPFISDMTVEAASSAGAFVTLLDVFAEDDVDGSIVATCSFPSGILLPFPIGTTLVTCSAVDTAFNIGTGGFNVVVQDTTAPVIVITPDSQTIEATSALGAEASYTATVTDSVDTGVSFSLVCEPESGAMFPLGANFVTCTAHDETGNAATGTVTVIVRDSTAPEMTPPADQTFEATGFMTTPVLVPAVAVDLVDPAPMVTSSHTSFPLGTTLVLWQSMDASGNIHFGVFSNVIIVDTTAPVVTMNGDSSVSLTVGDVYTELGATATDIHDTELSVTIGGDTVNTAVASTYHVTYDAVDSSGNHAVQQVRTVVVNAIPSSGGTSGGGSTYVEPTPPSFGDQPITIGGGLGSTSTVTLTFNVANASWMAISETPDFSGTSWVPYTTNTTFTFSASNTERKLYIKFRRVNGGETKVQEVNVLSNSPLTLIQAVLGVKITRLSELMAKLKLGSRGAEVVELQELLKQAGVFPANQAATGYYGSITLAAVNKALAASKAVLGIKIARVDELVAKLKLGGSGAEVMELQNLLKQAGYFPVSQTATGYYGPITSAAVKKYLVATK